MIGYNIRVNFVGAQQVSSKRRSPTLGICYEF